MTKEQFDQFKFKILKLSGDAEIFWEEIKTLQTTKEKAIHLVREQKQRLDLREEELRKAKNEIKNFKSHLQEAITKIKELEREKMQSTSSQPNGNEAPSNVIDLKKITIDFDSKLAKKEEEERFNYFKKMELG